jgi:MFS family permease
MIATLRQHNFALVWFGGLISLTGDWMLNVALPVYVYLLTRSVLTLSIVAVVSFVPRLLLSSLAGVFADRWSRKRTMIVSDVLLALALLPLLAIHSAGQVWIVYPVAFVAGCVEQFFAPAESALLPTLVGELHLVSANALNGFSQNVSRLVGPALGGLVVALWGLPGVVAADAASFVISAALIALITVTGRPAHKASAEWSAQAAKTGLIHEWLEGLRLVSRERALRVVFVMMALTSFGEGLFGVLLVVFVTRVLRGGALQLGYLMSAQAVGGILGGLAFGWIGRRLRPARLLGIGALLFGLLDLLIVNAPGLWGVFGLRSLAPVLFVVLALFALVGIPGAAYQAGFTTLLQVTAGDRYLGRVFGALLTVMAITMLGGMGTAGGLGDRVGAVPLLNLQGGVYVLAGLICLLTLWGSRVAAGAAQASNAEESVPAGSQ